MASKPNSALTRSCSKRSSSLSPAERVKRSSRLRLCSSDSPRRKLALWNAFTASIREAVNAFQSANILRGLSLEQSRSPLDLFTRAAGEMLDGRFDPDLVKAL